MSLAVVGGAGAVFAEQPRNLAAAKPYVLSPAPNYDYCKDDGDAAQLTDGEKGQAIWTLPRTVGWSHISRAQVTIDLGAVESIGRVGFHVAGGGHAGVYFPAVTAILVSPDGEDYRLATAIGSGLLTQDTLKAYTHAFETGDLNVLGRYVRLVFQACGTYVFLDEIEVFAAEGTASSTGRPMSDSGLDGLFKTGLTALWLAGEWKEVREQVRALSSESGAEALAEAGNGIQEIDRRMERLDVSQEQAVGDLYRQYRRIRAQAARAILKKDLVARLIDPWTDLRGSQFPGASAGPAPGVNLTMWQDEHETIAVELANLRADPATVTVRISPLLNDAGAEVSWSNRLWLREARAVPVRLGYRVFDPLTLLATGDAGQADLTLDPGECKVLWFTAYSLDLPAGQYRTTLEIDTAGQAGPVFASPWTLNVAPLRMPKDDQKALWTCTWDYLKGWGAPGEALQDLREHGVNVFILHPESLPAPVFNADRTKLDSVNFTVFDEALARAGTPRRHGVFWGEGPADTLFDLDKPSEQDLFKQWIRAWADHLRDRGYGPDRYFFYPYDEKIPERFVTVARLIKEVDPRLQIYCNQVNAPPEMVRRVGPYIDIWCVYHKYFSEMTAEQRQALQDVRDRHSPQLWTYACDGPGKALPPGGYYRRLSWLTFDHHATGAGFWCYLSNNGTWDDFDGSDPDYSVVYFASDAPAGVPRAEAIIPSRRWEAWREGAEDYEYLHRLRQTIDAAREAGVAEASLLQAEDVLKRCVQGVMEDPGSLVPYDRARAILTDTILGLRVLTGR